MECKARGRFTVFLVMCTISMFANLSYGGEAETPNLVMPVRVHVLFSQAAPDLNATISEQELMTVFEGVNLVWSKAGIEWKIETITPLQASEEQLYLKAAEKGTRMDKAARLKVMRRTCKFNNRVDPVINLCVVGLFPDNVGGAAFRSKKYLPFVIWPVESRNNLGRLNAATLAHELGHVLGLRHNSRSDIYLMKGGGNNMRRKGRLGKVKLTKKEINWARDNASRIN